RRCGRCWSRRGDARPGRRGRTRNGWRGGHNSPSCGGQLVRWATRAVGNVCDGNFAVGNDVAATEPSAAGWVAWRAAPGQSARPPPSAAIIAEVSMRIVVMAGGIGGARFLQGVRAFAGTGAEVTAVVNVGDDVTLHGLRICPDLDSVMYTLGGGAEA